MLHTQQINSKAFNEMLNYIVKKRSPNSYNGLNRKITPKWIGWKYINLLKKNKLFTNDFNDIGDFHFNTLDTMALNYYTIMFLSYPDSNIEQLINNIAPPKN